MTNKIKTPSLKPDQSGQHQKWVALSVISICTLMNTLDGGIVSITFPAIASEFNTNPSTVLWTTVAFWVVSVGLVMTMGWLGDVVGHRQVFTFGSLIFSLGLLLSGVATSIWFLVISRIIQGIGAAMTLSTINALITMVFPANERGKAMGVSGAVVGLGLTSGPLFGGILMKLLGWRALFYLRSPIGLLAAWLAGHVLPTNSETRNKFRIDVKSSAILFATLASFLLFINRGGVEGYNSLIAISFGVTSLLLFPALLWSEHRSVRPIIDTTLVKTRNYIVAVATIFFHYMAYGPIILIAPFFFVDALGFSEIKLGIYVAAVSLARTFLAPFAGRMSDELGGKVFLILGSLISALALFWLSTLGFDSSELVMLSSLLIFGVGSAFFEPVVTNIIMGSVPEDRLGTASASIAMGRQVAFAIGVAMAGAVFTIRERIYKESLSDAESFLNSFGDVLLSGLVFCLLASVIALLINQQKE